MKYRSTDELKASLDRIEKCYKIPDRIINAEFKALIPAVMIGSVLIVLVSAGSTLKFILLEVAFLVGYLVLSFMIPFAVSIISSKKLLKKWAGGKAQSSFVMAFHKKYKDYFIRRKNDLCSDEILAETEKLAENESDTAMRFALECCLLVIYGYRMEKEKMTAALERARQLYDPAKNERFSLVSAECNHALLSGDTQRTLRISEENPEYLDWMFTSTPDSIVDYAINAEVCKYAEGEFQSALEYVDCAQKLHERGRNILPMGVAPARTERENYRRAALSLDKARLLFKTGHRDMVMKELDNCDLIISDLKCEVPPLFIKEHQELMDEMKPFIEMDNNN